jgi:hypothetical protein
MYVKEPCLAGHQVVIVLKWMHYEMNMLQHAIVISLHGHMWIHVELIRYGLDLVYTQERASMFAWQYVDN